MNKVMDLNIRLDDEDNEDNDDEDSEEEAVEDDGDISCRMMLKNFFITFMQQTRSTPEETLALVNKAFDELEKS